MLYWFHWLTFGICWFSVFVWMDSSMVNVYLYMCLYVCGGNKSGSCDKDVERLTMNEFVRWILFLLFARALINLRITKNIYMCVWVCRCQGSCMLMWMCYLALWSIGCWAGGYTLLLQFNDRFGLENTNYSLNQIRFLMFMLRIEFVHLLSPTLWHPDDISFAKWTCFTILCFAIYPNERIVRRHCSYSIILFHHHVTCAYCLNKSAAYFSIVHRTIVDLPKA